MEHLGVAYFDLGHGHALDNAPQDDIYLTIKTRWMRCR